MDIQWYCENIYAKSGYSDEAWVMINGLKKKGVKITIIGVNKQPDLVEFEFKEKNDIHIPIVYHTYRHGNYKQKKHQYSIVRTMLEVSRIPQNWVCRFNKMDEVWVPNRFNHHTFKTSGVKEEKIFIIPSPIDFSLEDDQTIFKLKSKKKYIFLSLFKYEYRDRKGLDILLKAYTETFNKNSDVCLVLKTKTTLEELQKDYKLSKSGPDIEIINEVLDRKSLLSLYRASNCFVLPSRGEGIGRPYLDAMQTGVPIIATAWSGSSCFLNPDNSFLIDHKLVGIEEDYYLKYPGFFGADWAEPELDDLKNSMQLVFKDRKLPQKKARQAKQDVMQFNDNIVSECMIKRLSNPLPPKNNIGSPNVFERLMPLFYPDLHAQKDVGQINRTDFKKKINSVLILGTGHRSREAFDYIFFHCGIKNIFFLDHDLQPYSPKNFSLSNLPRVGDIEKKAEIVVLAVNIKMLRQIYHSLINKIDSIPIYIFD
jgi:glycosyltransferase involved in cell wall biosynthesis